MRDYKLLSKVRLPNVTMPLSLSGQTARQRALAEQRRRAMIDGTERWQRVRQWFMEQARDAWIVMAPVTRVFMSAVAITHLRLPKAIAVVARSLAVFLMIRSIIQLRTNANAAANLLNRPPRILLSSSNLTRRSRL
jgi:hypothetical protein